MNTVHHLPDRLNVQFLMETFPFESKIERITESGCWLWTKTIDDQGYGKLGGSKADRNKLIHRIVYELYKGPIPDGYQVDHLCNVRCCVNPDHLEAVTPKENHRRMMQRGNYKPHPENLKSWRVTPER